MELALLPIAALLLLISGGGGPVHAGLQTRTTDVLIQLFGPRRPVTSGARPATSGARPATSGAARSCLRRSQQRSRFLQGNGAAISRYNSCSADHVACAASAALHAGPASDRKQYRTRFGFAEGAYLAVGPPVAALLPRRLLV